MKQAKNLDVVPMISQGMKKSSLTDDWTSDQWSVFIDQETESHDLMDSWVLSLESAEISCPNT